MSAEVFVDTNILVYAHDLDAGAKHERAKQLVGECWQSFPLPWISVQVLQELLVTLRRKGVEPVAARQTVEDYSLWRVVENDLALFRAGMDQMTRWQISFWDGLILAAARSRGATIIWSEDLNDEQDYDGVRVRNPFR